MESCVRISLSEYIDPDQSQRFDHSGRNEIWWEPFPPARACLIRYHQRLGGRLPQVSVAQDSVLFQGRRGEDQTRRKDEWKAVSGSHSPNI